MINYFIMEGRVGSIVDKAKHTALLINCQRRWFDERTKEWREEDNWHLVNFFNKKRDAIKDHVKIGDRVIVTGEHIQYPKIGPDSRTLLSGEHFRIIRRFNHEEFRASLEREENEVAAEQD